MGKNKFDITGMSCATCAANIQKAVQKLPGVTKAEVNLLANIMVAEYNGATLSPTEIEMAVEKDGYGAALQQDTFAGKATTKPRPLPGKIH